MTLTQNDTLSCYQQIVDILSRTEFNSKFYSLKEWEDRKPAEEVKKDEEEESAEKEDES
jgi:hypothetical protein